MNTTSTDLLVVGSVAYDTVETPLATAERILGGSGSFFSVAASYFCKPGVVAVVGDDFDPAHEALLRDAGVDLTGLQHEPGETFFWRGRYDADLMSRTSLATDLGVFADFRPHIPDTYVNTPYLFLANIAPELQLSVLEQVSGASFIGLDTMDFWINGSRDALNKVLRRVDAVFINDEESQLLTGHQNVCKAARDLQAMGPDTVVIKRGEHGAIMFSNQDIFYCPAFPLESVKDPTGAGDSFAGGFMGYLAETRDARTANLRRAAAVGTVMASFAVEDFSLAGLQSAKRDLIIERFDALRTLTSIENLSF